VAAQGFIDEIRREYEEAAMNRRYTRLQASLKVVLPQAATVSPPPHLLPDLCLERICLRVLLTSGAAQTHRPSSDHHRRRRPGLAGGQRGTTLFLIPILVVHRAAPQASAARHTFGEVRK